MSLQQGAAPGLCEGIREGHGTNDYRLRSPHLSQVLLAGVLRLKQDGNSSDFHIKCPLLKNCHMDLAVLWSLQ